MVVLVDDPLIVKVNKVLKGRATICGGALRSYLEGNSPRDIDIFITVSNTNANPKYGVLTNGNDKLTKRCNQT